MTRLLQFTDMHLLNDPAAEWRGAVPQRSFEATLYHARRNHWPADAVLLTGDLANDEFDQSYARLAHMARRWDCPVIALPGNHDDPVQAGAAFSEPPLYWCGQHDLGNWRIVALDSRIAGQAGGSLPNEERERLRQAAAGRGHRHLAVTLHHPPVVMGSRWLDSVGMDDGAEVLALLEDLEASLCLFGHVHQAWDSQQGKLRILGTPSTGTQFLPRSDEFALDTRPPAYRWLELHDDGTIDTDICWLPDEETTHA
ncbi:MAG: metallophosphoesterase [Gammaproteobacteria bacterium]|nr:metallophosphoesterase [Gammaproteobacteria bacterium]